MSICDILPGEENWLWWLMIAVGYLTLSCERSILIRHIIRRSILTIAAADKVRVLLHFETGNRRRRLCEIGCEI